MTDIIDRLKAYADINEEFGAYTEANCAYDAIEEIKRLRAALHVIAHDPVEMSHDKVQMMYHKHIMLARKTYDASFPRKSAEYKSRNIDDNF